LPEAARLVSAFPNQQFVLNHCGCPIDRDANGMQAWCDGLRQLSRQPDVTIMISDLVAYDHNWTIDSLWPVVMHCIDCFGSNRSMFASDFPVARLYASFDEVYKIFKTIVQTFSVEE
jgi:predicted TIM-barrel fold metal-dependent hydrolase